MATGGVIGEADERQDRACGQLLERDAEIRQMANLLDVAAGGDGRLLLVEGEGGIGKTSLLEVLVARAYSAGARVLAARGAELEREFSHGVARQLFEPVVHGNARTRRPLLTGAAELAAPALGLAESSQSDGGDADAALAVNHGLYWLTANLAEDRSLVLVIDDAHWADSATLLFLHYLGRRLEGLRVLVALGLRPTEPGSPQELLDAVRGLSDATLLTPSALTQGGTAKMIRRLLGRPPDDSFARACFEATDGNPFLLGELLRTLSAANVEPDDSAAETVARLGPPSISRSVLGRLAVLWPEAVSLARAVAVLDTDARLAHAAALADVDLPAAATAADALTDAHVFGRGRPLRFAHPITRRAVYEDLPHGRRALDHARAATILESAGEPDRAAVHLLASEPFGDPSVAERLRAAAARAIGRGAPAAALALLKRALEEPPAAQERTAVTFELGRAARLAGDPEAPRYLRDALDHTTDRGDRVETVRELGAALMSAGDLEAAAHVLEREADALPEAMREERFMLEAELLTGSVYDDGLARRAARRIEHLLPRVGGGTPAERVLLAGAAFHRMAAGSGTGSEVAGLAERATVDALIVREQSAASLHPQLAVSCLLFTDRHDSAAVVLDAMSADARESGSPTAFAWTSTMRARFEHVRGNPLAAEANARAALALFPIGLTLATELTLGYLVFALVEQGRLEEAHALLEEYGAGHGPLSSSTSGLTLLLARSALRLDQGRLQDAFDDADEVVRRESARGGSLPGRGFRWMPTLALRAAGDETAALRVAERNLELARTFGVPSGEGIALLVLGLVVGGEEGLGRVERAAEMLASTPRRLDHAHAVVELGAALRRANRRSDAREPLRRGMDLAHRCGAVALAERAREELVACGARPRRLVLVGVDSLTASERRVAQMAADGMSNPEIAQALYVTRKTVEAHLRQVFRKLDIASRDQLDAALRTAA